MPPYNRHDPTDRRTRRPSDAQRRQPPQQDPSQQPPQWVDQQGQPMEQYPQQGQQTNQPRQGGQEMGGQQYVQQPQQQYDQQGQPTGQPQQTAGRVQSPNAASRPQRGRQRTGSRRRQSPIEPVAVTDLVTADVVTAERDTPIRTVVTEMAENGVGSVVIVERGRPVGILTDRAIALALEETPDVAERSAGDLTGDADLVTADTSMSILDVLGLMSDHNVRRIPVVDGDELEGIVTLDDVLVHVGGVLDHIVDTVRSQSPRL